MKNKKKNLIKKMHVLLYLLLFFAFSSTLKAQEYKYEIGGIGGTSFYMGDANKTALFKHSHLAGGIIFRYNQNFRWAYKANLLVGGVSGKTDNSKNVFPNNQNTSFSRTFYELGGQIEFNFFHYSDQYGYLGAKRFSPYIFTGLGVTYGSGDKKFWGLNLPLGVGLKYKLKERLNIGFEFSFRKLFGDDFDVTKEKELTLDDPYNIKSNFLKNKDWYVLTMFTISWDFGLRDQSCVNSLY